MKNSIAPLLVCFALGACALAPQETPPSAASNPRAAQIEQLSLQIKGGKATPDLYAKRGHLLAESGEMDEALSDFDTALLVDGKNAQALLDRSLIYHVRLRHQDALRDIELAAKIRPDSPRIVGAKCIIRVAALQDPQELAICEQALALPGPKSNAYTSQGQAHLLLKQYSQAKTSFEKALQEQGNNMRALFGLGLSKKLGGDSQGQQDMAIALSRLPGAAREFALTSQ